jgi:hypothetical protein
LLIRVICSSCLFLHMLRSVCFLWSYSSSLLLFLFMFINYALSAKHLFRFRSGIWSKFMLHRDIFYSGCWQNVSTRPNKAVIHPDYHFWRDIH